MTAMRYTPKDEIDARAQGRTVLPQCSYAAAYLERNPEYADLRATS